MTGPDDDARGVEGERWPSRPGLRVAAFFPHPDDESYAAGGLLARCAAHGAVVALVCASRGERGEDRHGVLAGDALAARRTEELTRACAALGAMPPLFCDLPDGGLADVDRGAAIDSVRDHLLRLRPHLAVTLGPDGAYGHRDHLAWTAIVGAAIAALPAADTPRLLHAVFPRRLFAPVWRLAERAGALGAIEQDALGVDRAAVELVVDVRPARARKLAALAAHDSQLDVRPGSFFRRLVEPLLDEEWYVVAHGPRLPPGATDPFAGL